VASSCEGSGPCFRRLSQSPSQSFGRKTIGSLQRLEVSQPGTLSGGAKDEANAAVYKKACIRLGVAEFEKLTLQEKQDVDWAGCCMHEELNSVDGGNTRTKQI